MTCFQSIQFQLTWLPRSWPRVQRKFYELEYKFVSIFYEKYRLLHIVSRSKWSFGISIVTGYLDRSEDRRNEYRHRQFPSIIHHGCLDQYGRMGSLVVCPPFAILLSINWPLRAFTRYIQLGLCHRSLNSPGGIQLILGCHLWNSVARDGNLHRGGCRVRILDGWSGGATTRNRSKIAE